MSASSPDYGGRGPLLLQITWAEFAFAVIFYAVRAATARRVPKDTCMYGLLGIRWDFIWATIAITCATLAQIFLTESVLHGTGNHEDLISIDNLVTSNLWSWIAQVVAITAATIGRIAVVAFLLLIQTNANGKLKWLLYGVTAATTIINAIEIGLIFRQCQPVEALWDVTIHGNCGFIPITTKVGFLQGSIGALADFTLALYPISIIGPLQQMCWRKKVGLCIVMAGGIVAGITAINKTIAIEEITKTHDITYETSGLLAWVWSEMWLIIIFGSIPPLWPLFKRITTRARMVSLTRSKSRREELGSSSPYNGGGLRLQPFSNTGYTVQSKCASQRGLVGKDDSSEEQILPAEGQIVVTKDTVICRGWDSPA